MQLTGNTILITGGATGIGLDLAAALLANGNTVIVCGRRAEKLAEARQRLPALITYPCDVGDESSRRELISHCLATYPMLNMLINNAGMQREIDFRQGEGAYLGGDDEVAINLTACLHLTALVVPHFMKQPEAAIVNVSSGLALVPLVITPVYSATKAALHSFSISLRQQLAGTSVQVFEVLPPIVDTDLDRGARQRRGQTNRGIPVSDVTKATMKGLANNQLEIPVGLVKNLRIGSRIAPAFFLKMLNKEAKL